MGALADAIASAAKERGAEIKVNAPVSRILVKDGRAHGVALADGTEYSADGVVSCLDANVTFLRLMDRKDLPADTEIILIPTPSERPQPSQTSERP